MKTAKFGLTLVAIAFIMMMSMVCVKKAYEVYNEFTAELAEFNVTLDRLCEVK